MAEKLWDLANVITGFAVAQALAMIFALGKGEFAKTVVRPRDHIYAAGFSALFVLIYWYAIWWCADAGLQFLGTDDQKFGRIWQKAETGREPAVIVFNLILWLVLGQHYRTQRRDRKSDNDEKRSSAGKPWGARASSCPASRSCI